MAKNSELFEHVQRYVREVMASRLREAGFVSYKGEDIHWYRLANNEVIHAVYFVTRHTPLHVSLEIQYGCHPLYIPPVFQKSPYFYGLPSAERMNDWIPELIPGSTPNGFHTAIIHGMSNALYRIPDVMVMCPQDETKGANILDQVLKTVDGIRTPEECYEAHKRWKYIDGEEEDPSAYWHRMSPYFIDEVLYWEDKSLYPSCKKYLEIHINYFMRLKEEGRLTRKEYQQDLAHALALQQVFAENRRDEYLQVLRDRENETLRLLGKYTGIRREP